MAIERDDAREEREYEAMRAWYSPPRCQCRGEMPGRCPGPAYCPICEVSAPDDDVEAA